MQLMSPLAGASRIAQTSDLVRGLRAEWHRLGAWVEDHLNSFVERQRSLETQVLPLRVLRVLNERLGALLDRAIDTPRAAAPISVRRPVAMAERMTEELEWALATQEFYTSAGAAERAIKFQETAALQIDAAVYALDGLFDDLRGIMSVQGRDNVFAHQAEYTEEHADTLYAAAVKAAVRDMGAPRRSVGHRRAA